MKRLLVRVDDPASAPVAEARLANSTWSRFWGLMLQAELAPDQAMLIDPSGSIHTMFMRHAIDVVYLDADNAVIKVATAVRPFRLSGARGARRVLEMRSDAAKRHGMAVGRRLYFTPVEETTR